MIRFHPQHICDCSCIAFNAGSGWEVDIGGFGVDEEYLWPFEFSPSAVMSPWTAVEVGRDVVSHNAKAWLWFWVESEAVF